MDDYDLLIIFIICIGFLIVWIWILSQLTKNGFKHSIFHSHFRVHTEFYFLIRQNSKVRNKFILLLLIMTGLILLIDLALIKFTDL